MEKDRIVIKFGGVSLKNSERLKNTASIIKNNLDKELVVVISAIGESTNELILAGNKAAKGIIDYEKVKGIERGYVYFQDFIPNNEFDIRIIVIDQKAFAIKRTVRKDDFRASGSGLLNYSRENFSDQMIKIALNIAESLESQSLALDFIIDDNNTPLIVEISYGFPNKNFIEGCIGYWDKNLNFHEGHFNPYGWMVESVLRLLE